jgi:hypothetical protein
LSQLKAERAERDHLHEMSRGLHRDLAERTEDAKRTRREQKVQLVAQRLALTVYKCEAGREWARVADAFACWKLKAHFAYQLEWRLKSAVSARRLEEMFGTGPVWAAAVAFVAGWFLAFCFIYVSLQGFGPAETARFVG